MAAVAVPLRLYFAIMWHVAFAVGRRSGLSHPKTATLAGVIGPLIEVPVLVALV
ncbi:hypothetical protein [Cyanobium gracile]|uniref:Uncharacterized protein n=1 Tax=Cyanobium gracile UHCC 0281 TaxID=3110309 RepID=A0ABU5SWA8_9CYAN|nr:hypothetical protein [Cyanobium gracile]MEA5442810.1 hypothetical protein [Cyanobium gracile UHCC 0281]